VANGHQCRLLPRKLHASQQLSILAIPGVLFIHRQFIIGNHQLQVLAQRVGSFAGDIENHDTILVGKWHFR
jgi:hypothetical protein